LLKDNSHTQREDVIMTDTKNYASTAFAYDPHWGALPKGELARLIGAGDENEVVNEKNPVGHKELGE
jgi:hypothetical protein